MTTKNEQNEQSEQEVAGAKSNRRRSLSTEMTGTYKRPKKVTYVSITSHPGLTGIKPIPVVWGAKDPAKRGPICCTNTDEAVRNAIGAHGGSYAVYRALAIASGTLDPEYVPDYTNTEPAVKLGPNPQWFDPEKIVTFDPFGALTLSIYGPLEQFKKVDLRPTIAITRAHVDLPEIKLSLKEGRLKAGELCLALCDVRAYLVLLCRWEGALRRRDLPCHESRH